MESPSYLHNTFLQQQKRPRSFTKYIKFALNLNQLQSSCSKHLESIARMYHQEKRPLLRIIHEIQMGLGAYGVKGIWG